MKVAVARLAISGWERVEIGNWLIEIATIDPDAIHFVVSKCPTPTARNTAIEVAKREGADFLFMVDDDTCPAPGFYSTALAFLEANPPAIIGSPYCLSGPVELVNVFHWVNGKVDHISREAAATRTGIERVAAVATGCCAYNMKVFDSIPKPYFDYTYNADHTLAIETEDNHFARKAWEAKIPMLVSWEHWAIHKKEVSIGKPT